MVTTNPQTLYLQGVTAIRRHQDLARGRRLLERALRLQPDNEKAWLWLSRIVNDPHRQRMYLERVLAINPDHPIARKRYRALLYAEQGIVENRLSLREIQVLLHRAEKCHKNGDDEGALTHWVKILAFKCDHHIALDRAIDLLETLGYEDDARELVFRAIEDGSKRGFVYIKAMDYSKNLYDFATRDRLRRYFFGLPEYTLEDANMVLDDHFAPDEQTSLQKALEQMLDRYPREQSVLLRLGTLHHERGETPDALAYFNRTVQINAHTAQGETALKYLQDYPPILTDAERASRVLAWREVFGFGIFLLVMGFQDAGFDFSAMGWRWLGVLIGTIGAYFVVVATSSPHQGWLARRFGQRPIYDVDTPRIIQRDGCAWQEITELRYLSPRLRFAVGCVGGIVLLIGTVLVFSTAISLIFNPIPPDYTSLREMLDEAMLRGGGA